MLLYPDSIAINTNINGHANTDEVANTFQLAVDRSGSTLSLVGANQGHYAGAVFWFGPIRCYATIDGVTVYSSPDSQAVRDAVNTATAGQTVKVAGYCAGVSGGQLAAITKTLTVRGGYTTTNWTTSDFDTYTTTLDAIGSGRVITASTSITIENLKLINGSGSGISGAGIYFNNANTLVVSNSIIMSNTVTGSNISGGGIYAGNGTLKVGNTTFNRNSSFDSGGAIYVAGGVQAEIENSTFMYNSTMFDFSGAIETAGASTLITNSTFYSNTAPTGGAAISMLAGTHTLVNNTFSDHSQTGGGGTVFRSSGTVNLINNIIANTLNGFDCVGTIGNNINNLIEDGTCNSGTITFTNFITGDPGLGPLQDNGGQTWTMAITSTSPAFDTGNLAACPTTDQRGSTRPVSGCDIGAYEGGGFYYFPIIFKN